MPVDMIRTTARLALAIGLAALAGTASAQNAPMPAPRPQQVPAAMPAIDERKPAKELFGAARVPAALAPRAIGSYAKGCLAGAVALPVTGETWQVMRLSRNRNWGHPDLIAMLERLAQKAPAATGWPGILIGDLAQPRGGPMLTGHASHQIGLDADVWLNPMPARVLTRAERENISAVSVVASHWNDIDPAIWTAAHLNFIKLAAQDRAVERVLVNPAIKRALCREATGDRRWLNKVRPWHGHNYHMHIRIGCPEGSSECRPQAPVPAGEGCGAELDWWFTKEARTPPPKPAKPAPPMRLADLPASCRAVLAAP